MGFFIVKLIAKIKLQADAITLSNGLLDETLDNRFDKFSFSPFIIVVRLLTFLCKPRTVKS